MKRYAEKNIYIHNGQFFILKTKKGKKLLFGPFPNFKEAKQYRDKLIQIKWGSTPLQVNTQKSNSGYKYIYADHGKFRLSKLLNGKQTHFGIYDTLGEAVSMRDYYQQHNWDTTLIQYTKPNNKDPSRKYITFHHGKYEITKLINGKQKYFGGFDTLREAMNVRDKLIANNWQKR